MNLNIFDKKESRRVLETLINSVDFYELHFTEEEIKDIVERID